MAGIITGISDDLKKIRSQRPLIVNMTNFVVMNSTANGLLAIGASPAMCHFPDDAEELAGIAGALVLNPGTPDDELVNSMIIAGKAANKAGIPVILDPVGVGATKYRMKIVNQILLEVKPAVIRGNGSEILALCGAHAAGKGVDSVHTSEDAAQIAKEYAQKMKTIVAVSGETDFITDGKEIAEVRGGDVMLTGITGTGCLLTALIGVFCSVNKNYFHSAIGAHVVLSICGEKAAKKKYLPGTFSVNLLDELYKIKGKDIQKNARIAIYV